jgi:hypothetical protein
VKRLSLNDIEKVARKTGDTLCIYRQALRDVLFSTRGQQGLGGSLNCSSTGDCARTDIEIHQVVNREFKGVCP